VNTFFLAQIGGNLIGLKKESVVGVGVRNEERVKPIEMDGLRCLLLPGGDHAAICDLQEMFADGEVNRHAAQGYYLIVSHQGQFMAVPMTGKGRLVMARETDALPLPPAFSAQARRLVSGVLVNCNNFILLMNMDVLLGLPREMRGDAPGVKSAVEQLSDNGGRR
jgi:hypothetical protein